MSVVFLTSQYMCYFIEYLLFIYQVHTVYLLSTCGLFEICLNYKITYFLKIWNPNVTENPVFYLATLPGGKRIGIKEELIQKPWDSRHIAERAGVTEVEGLVGSPGWCGSVDWAPAYESKGRWFDSQSRAHAWVAGQVPSRAHTRGNHPFMFLSLSFFLPSPLSKNKLKQKRMSGGRGERNTGGWRWRDSQAPDHACFVGLVKKFQI